MPKKSAGLLVYRWVQNSQVEVFLGHPGGPYFAGKENDCWSVPKGEFENEEPIKAAIREFEEETGTLIQGEFQPLTPRRITSSKVLYAFMVEADLDHNTISSNTFELEWPPRSGDYQTFPEIDRAGWFDLATAYKRISKGQRAILDEFLETMNLEALLIPCKGDL